MAQAVSICAGIVGQERACRMLDALHSAGHYPSLLFIGPPGVGKRSVALRLAQTANCGSAKGGPPCGECPSCRTIARLTSPDLKLLFPLKKPKRRREDDESEGEREDVVTALLDRVSEFALDERQPVPPPAHVIHIELVRWLRREMARPPLTLRQRFFIIVDAHRMTTEAANALLKILEEPQRQTTFVLTTSRPNQLLDTIRSRCRPVKFNPVPTQAVASWLTSECGADTDAAELAAEVSDGSVARALSFLDNPDDFLVPGALKFFGHTQAGEEEVLAAMNDLSRVPLPTVVGSLLFLYRQALRAHHGLSSDYARREPAIGRKAKACSDDYLRRAVKYLSGRIQDSRLYVDRRLFLYTLLSSLRRAA